MFRFVGGRVQAVARSGAREDTGVRGEIDVFDSALSKVKVIKLEEDHTSRVLCLMMQRPMLVRWGGGGGENAV